jgi:hypothetical protein
VKSFVGTSENALRIQIWTALIAILLLKWLHHLSKAKWSLSNLAPMLRLNLFTYRDLRKWLDDPFETPPMIPESQQLTLALTWLGQARQEETLDLDLTTSILSTQGLQFQQATSQPVLFWTAVA